MNKLIETEKRRASAISNAKSLDDGGKLTEEPAREAWTEVSQIYLELVEMTPLDSDKGIAARREAVMAACKAMDGDLAINIFTNLVSGGNITPELAYELRNILWPKADSR